MLDALVNESRKQYLSYSLLNQFSNDSNITGIEEDVSCERITVKRKL